jgi:tetratricopeptide (TPR) repeat protein
VWARMEREFVELRRQPKRTADALLEAAREAIPILESARDHRAVGRALILFGWVQGARRCDNTAWLQAAERALDHHKAAGWSTSTCLGQISAALLFGPTPAGEATVRIEELLERDVTDRAGQAYMLAFLAVLMAQGEEPDSARECLSSAQGILDELGLGSPVLTYTLPSLAQIELLAGRPAAAVSVSRELCRKLEQSRNFNWLASSASLLAEALVEVGKLDEALHWTAIAEEHAADDDLHAHMRWRPIRATVHEQREEFALAEPLAREAVALADRSDDLNRRANAHRVLAQVLRAMGNAAEGAHALSRAAELYEEKGNAIGLAQVRALRSVHAPASR